MNTSFELCLFTVDPFVVVEASSAGIDTIVVDWEYQGKHRRQQHADTEINQHTLDDLRAVRAATRGRVMCRINGFGRSTADEVEAACDAGADELLLPMVRTAREVEAVLELVRGRAGLGILIETEDAVAIASRLCRFPISRVFVGLNDLAIDRGRQSLFEALADGTVERVRDACAKPLGFGGLTDPDLGAPIPCRLLIAEMARLSCGFAFLRRSFLRDVPPSAFPEAIAAIRDALWRAAERTPAEVIGDRAALVEHIGALLPA
jgi:hypothetical protein